MIPKKILSNKRIYNFVKEYPNHVLYQEENGTYYESFTKWDLGLIKKPVKIPGAILKDRNGNKLN